MSNIAEIKKYDVANGIGVRVSVFLSGCPHHCPNCFNQELWNENYGRQITHSDIETILESLNHTYISGLSILGGEPMTENNVAITWQLAYWAKRIGKTVWIYTGYTYEELEERALRNEDIRKALHWTDVLVDGRFIEALADKRLLFRGSSNQRIIDVPATLESGRVVLWDQNTKK